MSVLESSRASLATYNSGRTQGGSGGNIAKSTSAGNPSGTSATRALASNEAFTFKLETSASFTSLKDSIGPPTISQVPGETIPNLAL